MNPKLPDRSTLTRTGFRVIYIALILAGFYMRDTLQGLVNETWVFLQSSWAFNSVYFETWWAIVSYIIILAVPFLFSRIQYFERYKIDPTMQWQDAGIVSVFLEIFEYVTPLMILDTFAVKKYAGVDPEEWALRRQSWIQETRALPASPPTVAQIVFQLVVSFLLYDIMFYCVHVVLHKNMWLYKNIHACHHDHGFVHSRITNKLTVIERVVLVLSANQSLKFVNSHPMTRMLFVPLFQSWLTENHCGYDFPWALDKVVPFGLIGGARHHAEHHTKGSRNYQPFFTYIDKIVNRKIKDY